MSGPILAVELPEALRFLNWGWWLVHIVAIVVLLMIGCGCGRRCRMRGAGGGE